MKTNRLGNATELKDSRYVQGGTTDRYASRLGLWERKTIEYADDDSFVEIQPKEAFRPDLVAYRVYGRSSLMWLVLQYNNIIDIQAEFSAGVVLRLPSERRLSLDILTQPTGGKRVKSK